MMPKFQDIPTSTVLALFLFMLSIFGGWLVNVDAQQETKIEKKLNVDAFEQYVERDTAYKVKNDSDHTGLHKSIGEVKDSVQEMGKDVREIKTILKERSNE